ncbi:MAG: hypothetical protein HY983_01200 [Candidatus Magasanikbacteria bacterium]|nr:hypothetical protein [Candidatus Magasanikbacteria bacterium]
MFGLSKSELAVFKKLSTPIRVQGFLDRFPINLEKRGETYMSPRRVLRAGKMHCLEGALVAALALWIHGQKPFLLDLKTKGDDDHVVTLYRKNGRWGAISKTNHATLRWRDPIYKTVRELAVSYFHEYFVNKTGKKTLRSYSEPFNLRQLGTKWITAEEELFYIAEAIDNSPHLNIFPQKNARFIRRADHMEKKAGRLIEWNMSHPRT